MEHSPVPVTPPPACLNCGASLSGGLKFCGACGQRTNISPKLTMRDIGHDLVHAITHADHSIFSLVRSLATRPGHVARDFIEGRRKRHFGPFAFLLISVGLASAVIFISGVEWFTPFQHGHAGDILQRHVNLVILFQMPLLAAFCALMFRRDRLSFADHLILAAYTSGFHALFQALIETPLLALTRADTTNPWLASGYFGVWIAYFAFASSQFYRGHRLWLVVKAVAAAVLTQGLTIAILMAFLFALTRLSGA